MKYVLICVMLTSYLSDIWRSNINFDTLIIFGFHRKKMASYNIITIHKTCKIAKYSCSANSYGK